MLSAFKRLAEKSRQIKDSRPCNSYKSDVVGYVRVSWRHILIKKIIAASVNFSIHLCVIEYDENKHDM